MSTRAITVRIQDRDFDKLTNMADTLGVSLPMAIAMTTRSAADRGYFDINHPAHFQFDPEQELEIEQAIHEAETHPERAIPIEKLMEEEGL